MEERKQHFVRPTMQRPPSLLNLTLVAIILGFMAGFGGYFFAQYILPDTTLNSLDLGQWQKNLSISLEQPLVGWSQKFATNVAGVYKPVSSIVAVGQPILSDNDLLGSAVVITSDGWLMSTKQVIKNQQVLIALGDKIYTPKEFKQDDFSDAVFIKIDANFLTPIDFQLTDEIKTGERLLAVVDSAGSMEPDFYTDILANAHYVPEKYLSTDTVDYYLKISNINSGHLASAPYFNLKGNFIGLEYSVGEQSVLIPAEYLKQAVKNLLNNTSRVQVGLSYVDLENNPGFDRKGVLIYNPNGAAIVYNSAAAKAGLKSGDQIVAINNNVVTTVKSLTSILQSYRVGEKVTAKIFRDGQEQDIEIKL